VRYRAGLIVACCSLLALVSCDRPDEASAAKAPASPNPPAAASAPTAPWQYQLQGPVDTGVNAGTFVVDGFDVDQPTVADLHRRGRTVICYVNAGAREEWRPDAARYPADIVGADLDGWPGERWLDIRQTSVLVPIMDARVAKCRQAGFDGVEWDNVDGYSNRSGFPLTYADQLAYNATLANLAHQYGLTVAIKNDVEQLADLGPYFDYAVNEQCQQYRECGAYDGPFTGAGKAVFQVEYKLSVAKFCPAANTANRNAILKDFDLFDTPYTPCR
jgi:hypothetical protein